MKAVLCKLSLTLALLYLFDLFINKLKTKFNSLFYGMTLNTKRIHNSFWRNFSAKAKQMPSKVLFVGKKKRPPRPFGRGGGYLPRRFAALALTLRWIVVINHSMQMFLPFHWPRAPTWPANNCQQIMVCSCAMSVYCFWLQIVFCSCVNESTLFSFLQLLNSVLAKYRDLSVSRRSIISVMVERFATDKSRYFAHPRPIIAEYLAPVKCDF